MKTIVRFGSFTLLFLFFAITPALAEEALNEETMTEEAAPEIYSKSKSLSRGALYRMRSKCAQLMNMDEWRACRAESINARKVSLDERRKTRDDYTKDNAQERSDAEPKPLKKVLPKEFIEFNRNFRNYDYLKESQRSSSPIEKHIRFRAERLRQRGETGGAGQRSRMTEDDSKDAENGADAE